MGENLLHPLHAGNQLNASSYATPDAHDSQTDTELQIDEEEPYTIKCICGFTDDDGNTVLCEQCNTWQHIDCYYFPDNNVPDLHHCADCLPRVLDAVSAQQRQRRRRFEPLSPPEASRVKRPSSRPHKKRAKDLRDVVTQQNGFGAYDITGTERINGIARDQQPPAKKPKTSHRHTPSISVGRSNSIVHAAGLPTTDYSRLPLSECPPDYFSPEFIKIHQTTDFAPATANTHLNLSMANLLSQWLDDKEEFAKVTYGKTHEDVFKQSQQSIEDLEQPIVYHRHEDNSAAFHGGYPTWPYLTVDKDVFEGDMIGEIRGGIGLLDDYKADPTNEWDRLGHPDHFVFFHPFLPIFIDCRNEGTLLRHARRSCRPNMTFDTIITGEREYRYCLTAMTDIPRGTEITIRWDLSFDNGFNECVASLADSTLSDEQHAYLVNRVSTVMRHFGGCACDPHQGECLLARFDRRGPANMSNSAVTHPSMIKKGRKGKRAAHGVTLQDPSRSGSEAVLPDDEQDDVRSTSRSSRSKTREPSPNHDNTLSSNLELSERERKKLLQQERLFNKMEHEEQHGPRRKKRPSGNNFNPQGKQISRSNTQASLPATSATAGRARAHENGSTPHLPNGRTVASDERSPQSADSRSPSLSRRPARPVISERPKYIDASTQTEFKTEILHTSEAVSSSVRAAGRPKNLVYRLLTRSQPLPRKSTTRHQQGSPLVHAMEIDSVAEQAAEVDVDMKDFDSSEKMPAVPQMPGHASSITNSHPPIRPPAPPWTAPDSNAAIHPSRAAFRSARLHVDLPPPLMNSSTSLDTSMSGTPGAFSSHSTQSPHYSMSGPFPSTLTPLITPGGSAMAHPSPVKKKMSLSAYTAKLKSKTPGAERPSPVDEVESASVLAKTDVSSAVGVPNQDQGSSPASAGARSLMKDASTGT